MVRSQQLVAHYTLLRSEPLDLDLNLAAQIYTPTLSRLPAHPRSTRPTACLPIRPTNSSLRPRPPRRHQPPWPPSCQKSSPFCNAPPGSLPLATTTHVPRRHDPLTPPTVAAPCLPQVTTTAPPPACPKPPPPSCPVPKLHIIN